MEDEMAVEKTNAAIRVCIAKLFELGNRRDALRATPGFGDDAADDAAYAAIRYQIARAAEALDAAEKAAEAAEEIVYLRESGGGEV